MKTSDKIQYIQSHLDLFNRTIFKNKNYYLTLIKMEPKYCIRVINTEHNSFERPIYAPMPRKIWRAKFIENKRYSAVTVLTEADSRCIGNRLNNVFVLPNPLTYSPLTDIPPKEKIILAAGRFDVWHYKGFDLLIKAWGMIAPKNKEWTLYMCLLKDDWLLKY